MPKPHWLQTAGGTSTPPVVVSFDTETQVEDRAGVGVMTLRCWDAIVRHRGGLDPAEQTVLYEQGETAVELADVLEAATTITGQAWAFAHNLGFDLTVTSLPMILEGRGWEPAFVNIGDESCVFALKRDKAKLTITDSWSWLHCSLGQAAKDVGMRKIRLPRETDDLEQWHGRCRHDVEILDRLLAQLMDWWEREQLGSFAVTGASCGWRSLRAHIEPKAILVGAEGKRTELEREAIFGGRKEVWQVGRISGRWVEDWDLVAAHLTTVANFPMPEAPFRHAGVSPPLNPLLPPDGLGAICRVEVTTEVPCAPVRIADAAWWPVGTFRTTLTTPELHEVVKHAASVRVIDQQWYRLGYALQPWAQWCQGLRSVSDSEVPRVVKRVAKGWGRSVPGRFALRTSELVSERPATTPGWSLETGWDLDTGAAIEVLSYGGVERTYRKDQDGADVFPAVLAFVEGYVRAEMARVIAARPAHGLLQCNTDGWWEIRGARGDGPAEGAVGRPFTAVRKDVARDVTVLGPNHVDVETERRLAGIPKDAVQRLDGSYAWQDWPGLRWQLQHSRPGEYLRPGREMMLQQHYCRRWVLTSGETVPASVSVDAEGETRLEPWSRTACRLPGDVLADHQVSALASLRDDGPREPLPVPVGARVLPGRLRRGRA